VAWEVKLFFLYENTRRFNHTFVPKILNIIGGGGQGDIDPQMVEDNRESGRYFEVITGTPGRQKPPRGENFWDMFKLNFCPRIKFFSVVVWIMITLLVVFIVQVAMDGLYRSGDLLQVNGDANTMIFSRLALNGNKVYAHWQLWRIVSCMILHLALPHLFFNCLTLLIFGSYIEAVIEPTMTLVIFVMSGILFF
jgi:membrane associated rhomboid family serine protease